MTKKKNPRTRSHDKNLRTLARYFLRDFVEILFPDIAEEIDFQDAKFVAEKRFADFHQKGHVRPDVVVELSAEGGEKHLVLFHAEMENRYLRKFEKRLLVYRHHLALKYGDECPILSAVVYRLGGPKTGIERREVVVQFRGFVTARIYYMAFSLSKSLAEDFIDRPQEVVGALAAMMGSEAWDSVEQKLRCYEAIRRADVDDEKRYLLIDTVDNYLTLSENEEERFDEEMRQHQHEETRTMIRTYSEAIAENRALGKAEGVALGKAEGVALGKAEGVALGKAEGVALGKAEGAAQGKLVAIRDAILLLARSRGSLPGDFKKRLETIDDLDRLYEILEEVPQSEDLGGLLSSKAV